MLTSSQQHGVKLGEMSSVTDPNKGVQGNIYESQTAVIRVEDSKDV